MNGSCRSPSQYQSSTVLRWRPAAAFHKNSDTDFWQGLSSVGLEGPSRLDGAGIALAATLSLQAAACDVVARRREREAEAVCHRVVELGCCQLCFPGCPFPRARHSNSGRLHRPRLQKYHDKVHRLTFFLSLDGLRHLCDLLLDDERSAALVREADGIYYDFTRQRVTDKTLDLLLNLAEEAQLPKKIDQMFNGEHLNLTEDRPVLHVATRARRDQVRLS